MGFGRRLGMLGCPGMGRLGTAGGSFWRLMVEGEDRMSCLWYVVRYDMYMRCIRLGKTYPSSTHRTDQ